MQFIPTALRRDPIYYHLYYVHMNMIFASAIPLLCLLYLNVATVRVLRKMISHEVQTTNSAAAAMAMAHQQTNGTRYCYWLL